MKLLLGHATMRLPVFIGQSPDGRYHVIYDDCAIGSYARAEQAVEDAAGGHTFSPPDGTNLGSLGLSPDIRDWVPAARLL